MKQPLYHKFIDEGRLAAIGDYTKINNYWVFTFSMACFSLCAGTFPTFLGYNFESSYAKFNFIFEISMFFWLFYFCIRLIKQENKYHVFKKKWYPYIFSFGYISLSVSFAIVAAFTTRFISKSDGTFEIIFDPLFYFSVFLPLFFTYLFFCYYSFMTVFAKYARENNRRNGDKNMY